MLQACRRRLTLVAAGELPPSSLLDGLASDLDTLVFVPTTGSPRLRAIKPGSGPATPLA
jgi:hypothetical protein